LGTNGMAEGEKFFQSPTNLPGCEFRLCLIAIQHKEGVMLKTSIAATILAVMALSPAYAKDLCNDAHMKQMDGMIAKMTDTGKQKEATAALDQSKAAMQAGNKDECMKYMMEAHKAMGL
jgi:hypothetical protein